MLWYSHLLKNFPQFIVIHTVKSFGIVNKAEIDVFLELSCFFHDPADVGNLISGSSAFSKTTLMEQSEEELKILLMKLKVESGKVGLKLNIQKIKSDTVSIVSPSISHEVMGPDAMIFVF